LLESKQKEQPDSRRGQWLTTSLNGPSRKNYWLRYCWVVIVLGGSCRGGCTATPRTALAEQRETSM